MKSVMGWSMVLVAALAAACHGHLERASSNDDGQAPSDDAYGAQATPDESGGYSSEAERTRAMEAKADAVQQRYKESMAAAATPEDQARAYQEFEQGRQELNAMGEDDDTSYDEAIGDPGSDSGDSFGPPPGS